MKLLTMSMICMLLNSTFTLAETNADTVLKDIRERYDGKDYLSTVTLSTYSKDTLANERKFYMLQKDVDKDELMVLAIKAPADVYNVGFLMRSFDEVKAQEDEQWMYLPAFRKVRRISAKDKRGAFMGSEYSYYDLDKLRVMDFDSKIINEEAFNGIDSYVIERIPKNQEVINKSGYYKLNTWVDKDRDIIVKQQYFDAKGILFKQLEIDKVERVQDIWTVTQSTMHNYVENKRSVFFFHETLYDQNVPMSIFKKSKLKRGIKDNDVASLKKISEL